MTKHLEGSRVSREKDIYNPALGYKYGVVIDVYSEPLKEFSDGFTLGPYPELYKVKWDDGKIEKGFLPHGISSDE